MRAPKRTLMHEKKHPTKSNNVQVTMKRFQGLLSVLLLLPPCVVGRIADEACPALSLVAECDDEPGMALTISGEYLPAEAENCTSDSRDIWDMEAPVYRSKSPTRVRDDGGEEYNWIFRELSRRNESTVAEGPDDYFDPYWVVTYNRTKCGPTYNDSELMEGYQESYFLAGNQPYINPAAEIMCYRKFDSGKTMFVGKPLHVQCITSSASRTTVAKTYAAPVFAIACSVVSLFLL